MMLWKRLPYLLPWRRRAAERDMQEELQSIAEMAAPGELGNLTLAAEDARAEWGWTRLEQTGQDIRYAFRSLRKSPGFAATVIVSLAIGIGANTALFTLINAVMWKLLPLSDPEHLLVMRQHGPSGGGPGFTYQQYRLLRAGEDVMELAAYSRAPLNVSIDGSIEPTAEGQLVSGNYFPLLGVRAQLGRLLERDDDVVPMGHPVGVISDGYWKSRFGQDPAIVGKQIAMSGVRFTIVGVTPPEFFGVEVGSAPQVFVPIMMQPVVMPTTHNLLVDRPNLFSTWLRLVGRVRSEVSIPEAAARLDALAQTPDWQPPNKFTGEREPVRLSVGSAANGLSDVRNQFSQPLFVLMGVVGIVLLVACANTGNLVLARTATRRAEFALRVALGAGRSRLIRQILVEGLVVSGLAGACGVALAFWTTQALVAYASAGRSPIALDLSPDMRVLAFTTAVSVVAGLLFGSVPAIRASRPESTSGARDLSTARLALGNRRPGRALIVWQVALSLVLLVGAGIFVRSLQNLNRHETDVDQSRVLIVRVEPRAAGLRGQPGVTQRLDRTYRDLVDHLERIPGVQSASLARTSPLTPVPFSFRLTPRPGGEPRAVPALMIYPRYFATMGIPIVRGRDFDESDLRPDSPFAVIVNEAFVRVFLNGRDPLGSEHGLREAPRGRPGGPSMSGRAVNIIGVVRDTRYPELRDATSPTMYQTFLQATTGFGQMVVHVKVAAGATGVARHIREAVQAIDRDVPMFELHTLQDEVDAALVRERLIATLTSAFGVVALTLIGLGLYGLMAFSVSTRTSEIGIRVALGARRTDVRWMIVRQALAVTLAGIAIGVPSAWILGRIVARYIAGLLFGVPPFDPVTIAASTAVLLLVAVCAGLVPAHRAARINPIEALRSE